MQQTYQLLRSARPGRAWSAGSMELTGRGEVGPARRLAALAVHAYTATGAVLSLLALRAVLTHEVRAAFLWLAAAVLIDATDGVLARLAKTKVAAAWVDGARMDDIVDYLTFVFVPVVLMYEWGLLPEPAGLFAACPLLASAFGFARTDAKTADYFFTGFPSYWNVVALYLYLAASPLWVNGAVLVALSLLVFVPVRYVYPSRTPALRRLTCALGTAWGAMVVALIWQLPDSSPALLAASAVYPAYYVALSLYLQATRRRPAGPPGAAGS